MNRSSSSPSSRALRGAAALALLLACAATARAQVTQRVSVSSSGAQGDGFSEYPSISAGGRFVVFQSGAGNLVNGDTNACYDVFVRDRQLGTTERVSLNSAGVQGNFNSFSSQACSISADGRFVVFTSLATNLAAGASSGTMNVFVRDRQSGTTALVSVSLAGGEGNGSSAAPTISADGRWVAFQSSASNLVSGDTNGSDDVFVRDLLTGVSTRASLDSGGAQVFGASYNPALSADGRWVAFGSDSGGLVPGDTNLHSDAFVKDRQTGATERISVDSFGQEGSGDSGTQGISISADGNSVAFASFAPNLVLGDGNGAPDIFVRLRQSGSTERASLDSSGQEGNGDSIFPSLSADGRCVAFESHASNLVPGDTNGVGDVFVRDLQTATTLRVSISSTGLQENSVGGSPSISGDGRCVAFFGFATNLVPGDTNLADDVFVHDRNAAGFSSTCEPGTAGVSACPCSNPPSGAGRGCDNSSATGGAILSGSGIAYLSLDSLVFTTSGEKPVATSIVLQGNALVASGLVFGQGLRCAGGTLKRLYTKTAVGGSIVAPDFAAGDPTVSSRSAAKGDPIQAGQSRWYLVYYRDPTVLGGCSAASTFNATQTGRIDWSL